MGIKEWLGLVKYNLDELYIADIVQICGGKIHVEVETKSFNVNHIETTHDFNVKDRHALFLKIEDNVYKLVSQTNFARDLDIATGTVMQPVASHHSIGMLAITNIVSIRDSYPEVEMPERATLLELNRKHGQAMRVRRR